jgi:hypothetical protein
MQIAQLLAAQNQFVNEATVRSSVSPASSTVVSSTSKASQPDKELLDVKETWDLIQEHWLYKCGHVRIEDVYQRLKEEADVNLHGMQKRVDVLNAVECCSTGRHYDLL